MPDYYFHVAGSLIFSAVTGTVVFLYFLLAKRKLLCALTAIILLGDIAFLIIFKETGLIEAAPIFAGLIMMNTEILRGNKIEASRETVKT